MNTNMNELSINEMELVNAGLCGIAIAACVVGVVSAAIKVADFVYDTVKGKQQTPAPSSQAASAVFFSYRPAGRRRQYPSPPAQKTFQMS